MMFFLTFVGQPHTNRLLLRQFSDDGRPKIVSKVGVSREASLKKSKKRRAKTSPAFSLDVFRTFFRQHRATKFTFDGISKKIEHTPEGS